MDPGDLKTRLLAPGLWMLIVAPIVTAVRAMLVVLQIDEPSAYWIGFALGGSLSALGMVLIGIALWGDARFRTLVAGAAVAFVGHYVLPSTPLDLYGPSLVQLGTGIVLWAWRQWAIWAGVAAAAGATLRHFEPFLGNLLLAAGAIALLWAIMEAATDARPDMQHTD